MRATQPTASSRRYTWRDFVALPDDDRRELVDGGLVEVEVPTRWHEAVVALLILYLGLGARGRRLRVLASGYKVRVRADRGAMPDVQLVDEGVYRHAANEWGLVRGRPRLAIEIVSPSSGPHDRVRKAEWYASIGVPEYWIVDVDERALQRFVLRKGAYALAEEARGDVAFTPRSMKGLSIPLAEIWEAVTPAPTRRRSRPKKVRQVRATRSPRRASRP